MKNSMKKIKNTLFALAMAPLIFYGCGEQKYSQIETSENTIEEKAEIFEPHPEVYDSLQNKFMERPGGIEEKIINKNLTHLNKKEFWKYKVVDSVETYSNFRNLGELEGAISLLETVTMMKSNFQILKYVDEKDEKDVKKDYLPLKNLMNRLDSIYDKNRNFSYKTLKEMYEEIGKGMNPSYEKTDLPIQDVISGKGGVCRDVISAYYPLLTYYGFNVGFRPGATDSTAHIWLYVNLGENEFWLDPSWYGRNMIPFENRVKEDPIYNSLKEKSVTRKNFKKN